MVAADDIVRCLDVHRAFALEELVALDEMERRSPGVGEVGQVWAAGAPAEL